jgi:bacteriocin biosynthesis cyclodehydratase domain-containing protein
MNDQGKKIPIQNPSLFSPEYTIFCSQKFVLFCGEDAVYLYEGDEYSPAVERLGISLPEAVKSAIDSRSLSFQQLSGIVQEFQQSGLLCTAQDSDLRRAAFFASIKRSPVSGRVALESINSGCEELLRYALGTNGLEITPEADFLIVATDDYLRPEINGFSRRNNAWLLTKPIGHTIWVGPLIRPGETVCYRCLAAALKANRWLQHAVAQCARLEYLPQPSVAALASTVATAVGMVSTAAAVYAATGQHAELENSICALDMRTMSMSFNVVRRCQGCADCGSHDRQSVSQRLQNLVSPITGIISRVEVTATPVAGSFHASAEFVQPLCSADRRPPLRPLRSLGKGFTTSDAQTSCIAEAVERYSTVYQGTEWEIRKRLTDVDAILPNDVLLFSEMQFRTREDWNSLHSEQQWIPEHIDPNTEIKLTRVTSVETGLNKLIPSGLCYMHYPFENEVKFCNPDTNGCAAGKTFEDALLSATLELIERDAVAIWWYNRILRPGIDLASFRDPMLLEIGARMNEAHRDLHVLDITTDLGIPAYVAISAAMDGSAPCFGSAAHVDPRAAATKAILEAAQVLYWTKCGFAPPDLQLWLASTNLRHHPYLRPNGTTGVSTIRPMRTNEALQFCCRQIAIAGIELLYLDLTRPEIGVPVVRAIAPGLRHFWARFGPGRLYDLPVSMGWVTHKFTEGQLNPVPCMI